MPIHIAVLPMSTLPLHRPQLHPSPLPPPLLPLSTPFSLPLKKCFLFQGPPRVLHPCSLRISRKMCTSEMLPHPREEGGGSQGEGRGVTSSAYIRANSHML